MTLHDQGAKDYAYCYVGKDHSSTVFANRVPLVPEMSPFTAQSNTDTSLTVVETATGSDSLVVFCTDAGNIINQHDHPIVWGTMTALRVDAVN